MIFGFFLELNTLAWRFMSDELHHDVDIGLTGNCAGGHKMCINAWRVVNDHWIYVHNVL
jgi:hypothetical protein